MKKLLIAAIAAVVFVGSADAAAIKTTAGTTNLVFGFSGLSFLAADNYDSGLSPSVDFGDDSIFSGSDFEIGMRYYLSDDMALRPSLTFGMVSLSEDDLAENAEDEADALAIGLSAVLERHLNPPVTSISPYIGVGAGFGLANGTIDPAGDDPGEGETELSATEFGLFGVMGFEAGVLEGITLGGEYRLGLESTSVSFEPDGGEKVEGSAFGVGFSTMSLYLSVAWN